MTTRMKIFLAVVGLHWIEHLFQAYQVYVLHMHRACALGLLGMKYPWLVRTESLHFGFALLTLLGMIYAGHNYFVNRDAIKLWSTGGLTWAIWHLAEHVLLFGQALTGHFMFGRSEPTSVFQYFFPRMEIHLFYNSMITLFVIAALIVEHRDPNREVYDVFEKCDGGCCGCETNHNN